MTTTRFNLIFEGEIEPGHNRDDVRRTLESLFEFDTEQNASLFSGQSVVLGESMDASTANSFQQALAGSGATTSLEVATDAADSAHAAQRRLAQRRIYATRRDHPRPNAIQPDRRETRNRRR